MAEFPGLTIWTDSIIGDTYHLTPAQFGAYLRLLLCAWRSPDCSIPNDDKILGRFVGDPRSWPRLKPVVMAFWTLGEDNRFRQLRLLDERNWCATKRTQQRAAGRASALKRLNRGSTTVGATVPTPTPTPTPTQKERKKVSKIPQNEKNLPIPLPPEWQPNASHFAYGKKKGLSVDDVIDEALGMRSWAEANGILKQNWNSMFMGWLKNHHKPNGNGNGPYQKGNGSHYQNGHRRSGIQDAYDNAKRNLDQLIEQTEACGDGLVGGSSASRVLEDGQLQRPGSFPEGRGGKLI